jgi:hypothetical protein
MRAPGVGGTSQCCEATNDVHTNLEPAAGQTQEQYGTAAMISHIRGVQAGKGVGTAEHTFAATALQSLQ